jgi:periplasmic protein CpxP/Spy
MPRTLATLAAVGGLAALAAVGGGCGHHHPRDPAEAAAFVTARVDDLLDDLNATDAQRTQVHALKDRLLADALKLRAGGEPIHAELLAQWSGTPDAARLDALVDERAEAMRAFAHEVVDAGVQLHGILTPEQREKLARKVERMHRWH